MYGRSVIAEPSFVVLNALIRIAGSISKGLLILAMWRLDAVAHLGFDHISASRVIKIVSWLQKAYCFLELWLRLCAFCESLCLEILVVVYCLMMVCLS